MTALPVPTDSSSTSGPDAVWTVLDALHGPRLLHEWSDAWFHPLGGNQLAMKWLDGWLMLTRVAAGPQALEHALSSMQEIASFHLNAVQQAWTDAWWRAATGHLPVSDTVRDGGSAALARRPGAAAPTSVLAGHWMQPWLSLLLASMPPARTD